MSSHTQVVTLRPSKEQFERPFAEYVAEIFRKHPDWPCFKVVPPKDWSGPRKREVDLTTVPIGTPIRQHAFGTGGAFKALLEEHESMTAAEFKEIATSTDRRPPKKGHKEDTMLERSFWSSLTFNPPLYGADTPTSLFDKRIPWGWNLRNLGDLLKQHSVPEIPGVTSPMTYFGMWRAFFAWHKEDCDLFSVNYLHFGAPKVWYCVPPSASDKFDAMAKQVFPEAAKECSAFTRHKDVLISPKLLRQYNVPFVQVRQRAGEFIVLNAAAYHAGFNMGFNCAEAVNFALEQWADVGRDCSYCECGALPDNVQLDMSIMFPGIYDYSDSGSDDSSCVSESESGSECSDDSSSEEEEAEDYKVGGKVAQSRHNTKTSTISTRRGGGSSRSSSRGSPGAGTLVVATTQRGRKVRSPAKLRDNASVDSDDGDEPRSNKKNKASKQKQKEQEQEQRRSGRRRRRPSTEDDDDDVDGNQGDSMRMKKPRISHTAAKTRRPPKILENVPITRADPVPKGAADTSWGAAVLEPRPVALVVKDPTTKQKSFAMMHRLDMPNPEPGAVWVGVLQEGADGLWRPTRKRLLTHLGCFFPRFSRARVEWKKAEGRKKGGWVLLTKPEYIVM